MTSRKHFASDNHAGAHPAVLAALTEANTADADSYGDDAWTARLQDHTRRLFGPDAHIFPVFNGTAANVLCLAALLRPFEAVVCTDTAHIHVDECAAPERFTGGKLLTVATPDGKLTPESIERRLDGIGDQHHVQPRVISLAQTTELGTCYRPEEIAAIVAFAARHGLRVHMDGARLANAVARIGCAPRDLTAGIDMLSFGATKNGGLAADAVVLLAPDLVDTFPFIRKQGLQLASKMRFLSAQLLALLDNDLWLDNARHANAMATRLTDGLTDIPGTRLRYPAESNAVFATLSEAHIARLAERWAFYVWDATEHTVRWMTAFDTTEPDVDAFLADIRAYAEPAP